MVSILAEAKLYALSISPITESVDTKYQSSTINVDVFRDESKLEVTAEPPLKKRKLGWISANDENDCDSVTLSYLITEFTNAYYPPGQIASSDESLLTSPVEISLRNLETNGHDVHKLKFSKYEDAASGWTCVFTFTKENGILENLKKIIEIQRQIEDSKQLREILNIRSSIQLASIDRHVLRLEIRLLWKIGASVLDLAGPIRNQKIAFSILEAYLPSKGLSSSPYWDPQDFYESVHVPSATSPLLSPSQKAKVAIDLYPFQQRAVRWLLSRESVTLSDDREELHKNGDKGITQLSFKETSDAVGRHLAVSHLLGTIMLDPNSFLTDEVRGGILAEEMGLGKTVELIALICLHTRDKYSRTPRSPIHQIERFPVPSGCTLIITPSAILQQWKSEIATHAPHLKVYHYQGISSRSYSDEQLSDIVEDLLEYDVVLTTYNVLAREIWYATPIADRNLRYKKKFKQRRSPLVQISWWRVCLDEAQMVEGGVSNAAVVARSIPRCNAWAVTGTPLRRDHKDLFGLFLFLRLEPYSSSWKIWERMVMEVKDVFMNTVGRITLRHTKHKIRQELCIPPQKRVIITMPFTTVEEQNYKNMFEEMCRSCDVSEDGSPLSAFWEPDDPDLLDRMRKWLTRLRQICLHPSTGLRNRRIFGSNTGPLRTVKEVLEVMIDNNASALRSEERTLMIRKLQVGHITAFGGDDQMRARKALKLYLEVLDYIETILKQYQHDLKDSRPEGNEGSSSLDPGPEDAEQCSKAKDNEQTSSIKHSLRQMLEVKHSCAFFIATAYYQIRTNGDIIIPDSEDFFKMQELETRNYDLAKGVRTTLLNESREKAHAYMVRISQRKTLNSQSLRLPYLEEFGGIESRNVAEKINDVIDVLNGQEKKMTEWRSRVHKILLSPLVDQDEGKDLTGEEYEDSTKQQDELYVLMAVLKAIVADRKRGITGQKNELVDHETRFKIEEARLGRGDAPELFLKLVEEREILKQKNNNSSLRGLLYELRNLGSNIQMRINEQDGRAKPEFSIVERHIKVLQDILTIQLRYMAELERDLDLYRTCTNLRLEFYKQLQHLSDQVAPYKDVLDETLDRSALEAAQAREEESVRIVSNLKTKRRFLMHLREENLGEPAKRTCVICQCQFESGILTVCGHIYCKECIQAWWREHKTCPVCKKRLLLRDFHDVSYKPQELHVTEEQQNLATLKASGVAQNRHLIYSEVDTSTMNEIKSINLDGSYGTKIDMLARHLLWLRQQDKGLKSIIFSQYSDFLSLLEGAFSKFQIGFSRITQKNGIDRFKFDSAVECFLLDAKANSSGLNLVQATTVFLCEPLINTAIELQAIARVHRIGQKRPTTVYMYLISNSVEESIYRISVARRLEHVKRSDVVTGSAAAAAAAVVDGMTNGNTSNSHEPSAIAGVTSSTVQENALDAANTRELEHASLDKLLVKGKSGGEAVDSSDLWNCLFGNVQKQQSSMSKRLELDLGHRFKEGENGHMDL